MLKKVVGMKTWKLHILWENIVTKDNLEHHQEGMKWHHLVESARLNGLWMPQRWTVIEVRDCKGFDGHRKGLKTMSEQ